MSNQDNTYLDVAAQSATAYCSFAISTTALVSGTTTLTLAAGDFTNTITARNIVAKIGFATGAATTTVVGSLTVTGVNARGIATTSSIAISTTTATGVTAWRSITSIAVTVTSITGRANSENALIQIGSGNAIGLLNDVVSASDVVKVIEAGAVTTTYTVNTDYDTITFVNAPDGSKDYQVTQKVRLW